MAAQYEFEASVIDSMDLSDDVKRYLKSLSWTQEEVPPVTSAEGYSEYGKAIDEIMRRAALPDRSSPGYGKAFADHARTRKGILATALGARMIEWEQETGTDS